jgi:hypothetical protein
MDLVIIIKNDFSFNSIKKPLFNQNKYNKLKSKKAGMKLKKVYHSGLCKMKQTFISF